MIVTVTPNAAMDKTLKVTNLQLGQRHRCERGETLAGGKGINVARALRRLGQPVVATGLAGGSTGSAIVGELEEEGILSDFVRIADQSRTSTVVIDPTGGRQTEIFEYGPEVTAKELATLEEKLRYLAPAMQAVVFGGSLPRRIDEGWYGEIIRELRRRKVYCVLDSEGQPLRLGVAAEPDLVAPNQFEAEELVGHEFSSDQDFVDALDEIIEMGAQSAIITRSSGAFAAIRKAGKLHRMRATIEELDVVSRIGSGDALLAGFLSARARNRPLEECLREAVGCGTANTRSIGAGRLEQRDATRYAALVTVEDLDTVPA